MPEVLLTTAAEAAPGGRDAPAGIPAVTRSAAGLAPHPALALPVLEPGDEYATLLNPSSGRYLRVRAPEYRLLCRAAHEVDDFSLASVSGVDSDRVGSVIARFVDLGLLVDARVIADVAPASTAKRRWLAVEACPGGARIALIEPRRALARLVPLVALLRRPVMRIAGAALGVVALWSLVHSEATIRFLLHHPLTRPAEVTIAAGLVLSLMLHELGHGVALTFFGGTVRDLGLLFVHGTPALYCDITDVWTLRDSRQRVVVAGAGPMVNASIAVICLVAMAVVGPAAGAPLAVLALANVGFALGNLIPVLRFDGYWMLALGLDIPDLRSRALAAAAGVAMAPLGRPRRSAEAWHVAFGAGCWLAGVACLPYALVSLAPTARSLGPVTAGLWSIAAVAVAVTGGRRVVRWWRAVWREDGLSRVRLVALVALLSGVVALAVGPAITTAALTARAVAGG